jgi:hypothetical protein
LHLHRSDSSPRTKTLSPTTCAGARQPWLRLVTSSLAIRMSDEDLIMMVEDLPHRRRTCSTSAASSAGCDLSYFLVYDDAGGGACELPIMPLLPTFQGRGPILHRHRVLRRPACSTPPPLPLPWWISASSSCLQPPSRVGRL